MARGHLAGVFADYVSTTFLHLGRARRWRRAFIGHRRSSALGIVATGNEGAGAPPPSAGQTPTGSAVPHLGDLLLDA